MSWNIGNRDSIGVGETVVIKSGSTTTKSGDSLDDGDIVAVVIVVGVPGTCRRCYRRACSRIGWRWNCSCDPIGMDFVAASRWVESLFATKNSF